LISDCTTRAVGFDFQLPTYQAGVPSTRAFDFCA
jgi:hypothetical protein